MKVALASLTFLLVYTAIMLCKFARANNDGLVFLERGRRGIVPCPLIASGRVTLEEIDAVYWYHRQKDRGSLLISYFKGKVAPQNGIPEGVYDINSEFSLVIEHVTASDEGIYFFMVKPRMKMVESGHVVVWEKVSPTSLPFSEVIGCGPRPSDPDHCDVLIETDTTMRNLTCVVDSVKPAVELNWFRVFADGSEEPADSSQSVIPVILPPNKGSALRNNTFSTSSSIQLTSVNDDVMYRCKAHGVAVGNGSHVTVSFVKVPSTSPTKSHGKSQSLKNAGTNSALIDKSSARTLTALAAATSIALQLSLG